MPSLLEIIREHELECPAPCRVSQWRSARLKAAEVPVVQKAIEKGRMPSGWIAKLEVDEKEEKAFLVYTRSSES